MDGTVFVPRIIMLALPDGRANNVPRVQLEQLVIYPMEGRLFATSRAKRDTFGQKALVLVRLYFAQRMNISMGVPVSSVMQALSHLVFRQ